MIIQLVKIDIKPFTEKNANLEKHGCQNSVAVVASMLTYTS